MNSAENKQPRQMWKALANRHTRQSGPEGGCEEESVCRLPPFGGARLARETATDELSWVRTGRSVSMPRHGIQDEISAGEGGPKPGPQGQWYQGCKVAFTEAWPTPLDQNTVSIEYGRLGRHDRKRAGRNLLRRRPEVPLLGQFLESAKGAYEARAEDHSTTRERAGPARSPRRSSVRAVAQRPVIHQQPRPGFETSGGRTAPGARPCTTAGSRSG